MFLLARHFTEGARMSVREKYGIVAEALIAAGRPHHGSVYARLELLHVTVGPGNTQG